MRADQTTLHFRVDDITLSIHIHDARESQTIHIRIERTDAIRKFKREHRNNPVSDIDRSSTGDSILIESAASFHIFGDIRDMNGNLISASQMADRDSVIKVVSIIAIDGDNTVFSEIKTSLFFTIRDFFWHIFRLC